jgi:hypothetical protein
MVAATRRTLGTGSRRLTGVACLLRSVFCLRGPPACVAQVDSHAASQFDRGVEFLGQLGRTLLELPQRCFGALDLCLGLVVLFLPLPGALLGC